MTYQSNADLAKQRANVQNVPFFRDLVPLVVKDGAFSIAKVSNVGDRPKLSTFRLEQYLNPCNPICSG